MVKKRKKLTSADGNLDPDVPTEQELRLEEELRLAYEAERLIDEGGGVNDVVPMHDETLALIDKSCDKVEQSRIGEEVELEKVLEQLTKEQLVVIVKEAIWKDKELEESVKKRFGFVGFKRIDNNDVKALDQKQKRLVSRGQAMANVEKRHLDKGQDQLLVSSRREGRVAANVKKTHLDEAHYQLQVSSRRHGHVAGNVEKRHLDGDEAQDQLRVSSGRDGHVLSNVERSHRDEGQDHLRVSSWRDGRDVANLEKRHLDEAQNQLRVSFRRNEKPELARSGRQKGKREVVAMPEVGAYGDEEQLHRLSWSDDYQNKYLQSEHWQGQHWFGVSAYDPTLTGARTFNPDFGHASSEVMSRPVAGDYWLNSFRDGTRAAPINQPGSLYSYNARYENIHDGYWRQNSQYMQPHSIYEDNRHHRRQDSQYMQPHSIYEDNRHHRRPIHR